MRRPELMTSSSARTTTAVVLAVCLSATAVHGERLAGELGALVESGHRTAAAQADAGYNDLTRGRLSAHSARTLLERAAVTGLPAYRIQAHLELARYALAAGDAAALVRHCTYIMESETDAANQSEAQYLMAHAERLSHQADAAGRRYDWISLNGSGAWRGWALYGQGQAALAAADTTEAIRLFKNTITLPDHAASAPALLQLGQLYDRTGRSHNAVRYLTMYREAYPNGILPVIEYTPGGSTRAEIAAGVTYAIQVGVFGERTNALRQKERFEAAGYTVRLVPRTVGGRQYTGVRVGRYRSQKEAQSIRRELEQKFQDTYRVVVSE